MNEAERRCPTRGALLVNERRVSDAASGTAIPVWRCEKQHWWMQSTVHGWVPIDPGAMVEEAPTPGEDESAHYGPVPSGSSVSGSGSWPVCSAVTVRRWPSKYSAYARSSAPL
jgi:hypothetical protein